MDICKVTDNHYRIVNAILRFSQFFCCHNHLLLEFGGKVTTFFGNSKELFPNLSVVSVSQRTNEDLHPLYTLLYLCLRPLCRVAVKPVVSFTALINSDTVMAPANSFAGAVEVLE